MAWGWVVRLVIYVVAAAISYSMREKPDAPQPATIGDFDVPTASENRPIPVAFGTVEIRSSNVVWYGDLRVKAIKKKGGKK